MKANIRYILLYPSQYHLHRVAGQLRCEKVLLVSEAEQMKVGAKMRKLLMIIRRRKSANLKMARGKRLKKQVILKA